MSEQETECSVCKRPLAPTQEYPGALARLFATFTDVQIIHLFEMYRQDKGDDDD